MFPKAHQIFFVIICNGWYAKDIIQTGITDYVDQRGRDRFEDYSYHDHDYELERSKGRNSESDSLRKWNERGPGIVSSKFQNNRRRGNIPQNTPQPKRKRNLGGLRNEQNLRLKVDHPQRLNEISLQERERSSSNLPRNEVPSDKTKGAFQTFQ